LDRNTQKTLALSLGQVAYYDVGAGKPILLLHGFPDTPQTFGHQVDALTARGYRCLVPYLPGYGASSPPRRGGNSMLAIAELMEEFMARLVPGETASIYGHDWGSVIAQVISSLHYQPKSPPAYTLDKLILCAVPPAWYFIGNMNFKQLYRSRYMGYFQLPGTIAKIKRDKLEYIRTLWSRWSPAIPANDPQLEDVVRTLDSADSLRQAILYYRYFFNPLYIPFGRKPIKTLWHVFRRQKMPCLIIYGADDGCIGKEMFINSANGYPHPQTKLLEIPGAGHFTHYEKPEEFNRAMLEFIEQR
jgi:epoxide hydrolase 4